MTDPSRKRAEEYQPDTSQSLDVLYGNAPPIETYIADRATREPFIANDTPSPLPQVLPRPMDTLFGPPKVSAEELSKRRNRQLRVWELVKAELIREELIALGWRRKDADGFPIIEQITKRFWVAAQLREGWNLAKEYEAGIVYNNVRVVELAKTEAKPTPRTGELFFDKIKVYPEGLDIASPVQRSSNAPPPPVTKGETELRKTRGGRENVRDRIKKKAVELWNTDPKFRKLKNRTEQARAVKTAVLGSVAGDADDMPECKLASAIRWVGQALKHPIESDGPA